MIDCGGCKGLGSHARECEKRAGHKAAMFYGYARRAKSLGDSVGGNDMKASSALWSLEWSFRRQAEDAAREWMAQ